MKKIIFLALIAFISISTFAQENFTIPTNYTLDKPEDYKLLEKDVITTINWLYNTPVNEQAEKRMEANAFFIKWTSGTPDVHIGIDGNVVNFMENPELLIMYIAGWAKYSIETGNDNDKIAGTLAGIEMAISFYEKNIKHLKKDKNVEKYIKMQKKGTLKEYIEKNT